MKYAIIAAGLVLFAKVGGSASALEGFTTCHGSRTTALQISGLDSIDARMVAVITMPDALEVCYRSDNVRGEALKRCANKTMFDQGSDVTNIYANCHKGTLALEYRKSTVRYKFPIHNMCAGDNSAAIATFRTLCPNYDGKIEKDGD